MTRTLNKETGRFEWDTKRDYSKTPRTTVQTARPIPTKTLQQHKDLLLYILTQTNAKNIHAVIKSSNLL